MPNIKMSISLIDSVSADQQNALKVVRASKPKPRKSSKVMFCFFYSFKASKSVSVRTQKRFQRMSKTDTCRHFVLLLNVSAGQQIDVLIELLVKAN